MHAALFSIKRLYFSSLAALQQFPARLGLTPARVDMMRVIAHYEKGGGIPQWKLARQLGIAEAGVSRMLGHLEERGLVDRSTRFRRSRLARLTAEGAKRLAKFLATYGRYIGTIVSGKVGTKRGQRLGGFYRRFNQWRIAFHDRAPFLHPWRAADLFKDTDGGSTWRWLQYDDIDDTPDDLPPVHPSIAPPE